MRTRICDITPPVGPRGGYCRWCGRLVRADSFRDSVSGREYLITALCQGCQDEMYLGGSEDGPPASGPVHRGAVFAAVPERGMPREGGAAAVRVLCPTEPHRVGSHATLCGRAPSP